MSIQLSMVGMMVRDMPASLAFYRKLGMEIPAEEDDKPFVLFRMASGVTMFWDTVFANRYDLSRTDPGPGYRNLFEYFYPDDATVDAKYRELVDAGYHGRMAPAQTSGPYAAMVDDPDGNVILITSDSAPGLE